MFPPECRNTQKDEISPGNPPLDTDPLAPTAADRLDEIQQRLWQMLRLAELSAGAEGDSFDRDALQQELERLKEEIDEIADRLRL